MKFVTSEQEIEDIAAGIENLIQSGRYQEDELVIICSEEHMSAVESMVQTNIDVIPVEDLSKQTKHFLFERQVEDDGMDLYEDVIRRGGYVLFKKNSSGHSDLLGEGVSDESKEAFQSHHSNNSHTKDIKERPDKSDMSSPEDVTPPGFGVDFNEPKSDADTHEDVLNPKGPNPDNHRR